MLDEHTGMKHNIQNEVQTVLRPNTRLEFPKMNLQFETSLLGLLAFERVSVRHLSE